MAEFHVGDQVVVLNGQGKEIEVVNITRDAAGRLLYGDGLSAGWYTESALDYALSPEQKDWLERAERRLQSLSLAVREAEGLIKEASEMALPPSLISHLRQMQFEAMGL